MRANEKHERLMWQVVLRVAFLVFVAFCGAVQVAVTSQTKKNTASVSSPHFYHRTVRKAAKPEPRMVCKNFGHRTMTIGQSVRGFSVPPCRRNGTGCNFQRGSAEHQLLQGRRFKSGLLQQTRGSSSAW